MRDDLRDTWRTLGIAESVLASKALQLYEEASALVGVETGDDGRVWQLLPAAASAWLRMQAAAAQDGVTLRIASAYRSSARQAELIQRKLAAGNDIASILQVLAPPGCSEHHTGRAVDIYQPGAPVAETAFEKTGAFAWLAAHADGYGFTLSFPRGNAQGYVYEPWHWCFADTGEK